MRTAVLFLLMNGTFQVNKLHIIVSGEMPEPSGLDDGQNAEPETCGGGEDNDGNGIVDERCGNQQEEPPASNPQRMITMINHRGLISKNSNSYHR